MTPRELASKELDHPCRDTCSGWKQGYEKGRAQAEERVRGLVEALEKSQVALREGSKNGVFWRENADAAIEEALAKHRGGGCD